MAPPRQAPTRRIVFAALLLGACDRGPGKTLSASAYEQACQSGRDCIAIFAGRIASCQEKMACPNAAIEKSAFNAYRDDVGVALAPCIDSLPPVCPDAVLTCPAGQCEYHPKAAESPAAAAARAVAAEDYPQTCATVDDCVPVYVGPLGCCDQGCPNAVISTSAMAQYESDVGHRTPACIPRPPCEPPEMCTVGGRLDCQNNHCVLLTATE